MKQKGFAGIYLLIGVLILVSLGGGYYFIKSKIPQPQSQTSAVMKADETANWQTYTNPTYAYSVKYPPTWSLVKEGNKKSEKITFSSPTDNILTNKPALVMIFAVPDSNFNLESWLQNRPFDSYKNIQKEGVNYIFLSGTYGIGANSSTEIQQLGKETLNKMFSSLIFSEQTDGWELYIALDNSYSFKYPDQWYIENPSSTKGLTFFKFGVTPVHSTSGVFGNESLVTIDYSWQRFDDLKASKYSDGSPAYIESVINGKRLLRSKDLLSADILINHAEGSGEDRILNVRILDPDDAPILDQILSTFKFLDQTQQGYTCPENGWVNCMPILTEDGKRRCSQEARDWYKENCPDFRGVAE